MGHKRLVAWHEDFGRMGALEGLFILDEEEWATWLSAELHDIPFNHGECLGKHSEVVVVIDRASYDVRSEDQAFISKLEALLGSHISGTNPMLDEGHYCYGEEDEYFELTLEEKIAQIRAETCGEMDDWIANHRIVLETE